MKLFVLAFLILLAGCGGGGSSQTSLEISQGFISNAGFTGGLIISGKNLVTDETFSVSLPTGLSTSLSLKKGSWEFSAVGWDGSSPFLGNNYCGVSQKILVENTESVGLDVSMADCALPRFNGQTLSKVITCNTFYTTEVSPANLASTGLVGSASLIDYCESAVVPVDLRSQIRSVRLSSVTPTPLQSQCYSSTTSYIDVNGLKLPFSSTPFMLTLFTDSTCSDPLNSYVFKDGLSANYSKEFDKVLAGSRLYLPANDLKRAMSTTQAVMPSIDCKVEGLKGRCKHVPEGVTFDYYITKSLPERIRIPSKVLCDAASFSSASLDFLGCKEFTAKGYIELTLSTKASVTGGSGAFAYGAKTYTTFVEGSTDGAVIKRPSLYRKIYDAIGDSTFAFQRTFLYPLSVGEDSAEDHFGRLSLSRRMLSPAGMMGAFGIYDLNQSFADNCSTEVGERTIRFYDRSELKMQEYRVTLSNLSVAQSGSYLCNSASSSDTTCAATTYEKRAVLYDHSVSAITPHIVMEFNCSGPQGKIELNESKVRGVETRNKSEIVAWNTDPASLWALQKMDFVSMEERLVNGNSVELKRSMGRVFKTAFGDYEMNVYKFNSATSGISAWTQTAESMQIKKTNLSTGREGVCFIPVSYTDNFATPLAALTSGGASQPLSISPATALGLNLDLNWANQTSAASSNCLNFTSQTTGGIFAQLPFTIAGMLQIPTLVKQAPFFGP